MGLSLATLLGVSKGLWPRQSHTLASPQQVSQEGAVMRAEQEVWLALTGTDIKVLEWFSYLERVGPIFPGQQWLAERLRVSERTIRRSIAHLKALGVILVQPRRCQDRHGRLHSHSNVYKLLGLTGAFIRSLVVGLTERPKLAPIARPKKKKSFPAPIFKKEELRPELLTRLPLLRVWWERG